jgi:hypothetical protein
VCVRELYLGLIKVYKYQVSTREREREREQKEGKDVVALAILQTYFIPARRSLARPYISNFNNCC